MIRLAFTVAGYLATEEEWEAFTFEWDQALTDFGVTSFHMVDFAHSRDEFEKWKGDEDKRHRFMGRLIDIIDRRVTHAFSMSVMREDYDAVNKEYQLDEKCASPYPLCSLGVVHLAFEWREQHPEAQMKFVFHDGPIGKGKLLSIFEEHKKMSDIAFMKCHRALEGADFAAYEHRAFLVETDSRIRADDLSPWVPRRTFELLRTKTSNRQSFKLLTDEGIRNWCKAGKIPRR